MPLPQNFEWHTIYSHFNFTFQVHEYGDHLPKFVCLYCWTKLANFHEFYNKVNAAKYTYVSKCVKIDEPNHIGVECDPLDIFAVKVEPIEDNVERTSFENISHENSMPHFEEANIDSNNSSFDINSANTVSAAAAVARRRPRSRPRPPSPHKTFTTSLTFEKLTKNNINHLITDYIDMKCHVCEYPFKTIRKARGHLRTVHKVRSIKMKCCGKKVGLYDIISHIHSHLNPEIYK